MAAFNRAYIRTYWCKHNFRFDAFNAHVVLIRETHMLLFCCLFVERDSIRVTPSFLQSELC
jgi:hypothetical protein